VIQVAPCVSVTVVVVILCEIVLNLTYLSADCQDL